MSLAQKHCKKLFSFPCIRCSSSQNKAYKKQIIPLNYTLPGTTLTGEEMERFRDKDLRRLIDQKKLNLIVDLDNTLIHTTTFGTLSSSDKEYMRKQLGKHFSDNSYILKKRPGVSDFLQQLISLFDITIYTLGGRVYANMVSNILDPDECIFKNVICYEDCTLKGQKRLDVVLSHERVVLVVDDLEEVWSGHTENLIQIEPYEFFESEEYDVEKLVKEESAGCGMDMELSRVMETLKAVHAAFYKDNDSNLEDLEKKDVRDLLKRLGNKDDNNGDVSVVSRGRSKKGRIFYLKRALQLALYPSF